MPSTVQKQGDHLRRGGASGARYAIVVEEPRGAASTATAVASDVFRKEDLADFRDRPQQSTGCNFSALWF